MTFKVTDVITIIATKEFVSLKRSVKDNQTYSND